MGLGNFDDFERTKKSVPVIAAVRLIAGQPSKKKLNV